MKCEAVSQFRSKKKTNILWIHSVDIHSKWFDLQHFNFFFPMREEEKRETNSDPTYLQFEWIDCGAVMIYKYQLINTDNVKNRLK